MTTKARAPGQWWDASLTPQDGCHWPDGQTPEGCRLCWAKRMARRWKKDTETIALHPERLDKVRVTGPAMTYGIPINCGDLFQPDVPAEFVWGVLEKLDIVNFDRETARSPVALHRFVFVTKRPARAVELFRMWLARQNRTDGADREYVGAHTRDGFLLMFSAWDQASVDSACAAAAKLPDGVRWGLHLEPLLDGPVGVYGSPYYNDSPRPCWVVTGGENGPGARAVNPDWFRQLRDECAAAAISFWFKGWGTEARDHDWGRGRTLDGREHNGTPWTETDGRDLA